MVETISNRQKVGAAAHRCYPSMVSQAGHGTGSTQRSIVTVDETSEMPTRSDSQQSINLDQMRGWSDAPDPRLRRSHELPVIARLVAIDGGGGAQMPLHGPDIYIGRFHPQAGPVDIIPTQLADHEIYKFAAPHVRLSYDDGDWVLVSTAPNGIVEIEGERVEEVGIRHHLPIGARIRLGVVEFEFEQGPATYDEWLDARKELLEASDGPTLFLKRSGAIAGPSFRLRADRSNVVGRRFPDPAAIGAAWPSHRQPDWNLSGLWDQETKFVGFRHAEFTCDGDEWTIKPISLRQRTYLNRVEIVGETPLLPGDEIGLGSVLLHFHHPADLAASTDHRTAELPAVVDWQREHTSPDLDPVPPANPHVSDSETDTETNSETNSETNPDSDADLFGGDDG
jgi:hypothetical protein